MNTKTGTAFRGVLWRRRRKYLILRNAQLVKRSPYTERVPIDGEVMIEAGNIDFLQVLS